MEELFEPVKRGSSGERVQDHRQYGLPGGQLHLAFDHGVDGVNQIDAFGKLFNDGKMGDIGEGQIIGYKLLHSLPHTGVNGMRKMYHMVYTMSRLNYFKL